MAGGQGDSSENRRVGFDPEDGDVRRHVVQLQVEQPGVPGPGGAEDRPRSAGPAGRHGRRHHDGLEGEVGHQVGVGRGVDRAVEVRLAADADRGRYPGDGGRRGHGRTDRRRDVVSAEHDSAAVGDPHGTDPRGQIGPPVGVERIGSSGQTGRAASTGGTCAGERQTRSETTAGVDCVDRHTNRQGAVGVRHVGDRCGGRGGTRRGHAVGDGATFIAQRFTDDAGQMVGPGQAAPERRRGVRPGRRPHDQVCGAWVEPGDGRQRRHHSGVERSADVSSRAEYQRHRRGAGRGWRRRSHGDEVRGP